MSKFDIKAFFKNMYDKPHIVKRTLWCFVAVTVMGFCVSWLNLIAMGADPYSTMNLGISSVIGLSFGNWQAIMNLCLFIIVFMFGRNNIGFGTILNMFVVGYACDFMDWLRTMIAPDFTFPNLAVRIIVMVIMVFFFVVAAAVYMSVDLGTSPFDATSFILANLVKKVPFGISRIIFDCIVSFIAFCFHGTIGIVTVLMVFTIGPCVQFMQKFIKRFFPD